MQLFLVTVALFAGLWIPLFNKICRTSRIDWTREMQTPTWDFTKSWASSITAVGTAFTFTGFGMIFSPTTAMKFMPRSTYFGLSLVASALVVLAPMLFNVLVCLLPRSCGRSVWGFLISAGLTVCGLVLQLSLAGILFLELWKLGVFQGPLSTGLTFFTALFVVGVTAYGVESSFQQVILAPAPAKNEVVETYEPAGETGGTGRYTRVTRSYVQDYARPTLL
jgi:hypothetical protein